MATFGRRQVLTVAMAAALSAVGAVTTSLPALGTGDEVTTLDAGDYQTCARKSSGTVWCWGYGGDGQLGDGTTGDPDGIRTRPVKVRHANGPLTDAIAVGSGTGHSCALKSSGTVWCWGEADEGQVGDGTTGDPVNHRRLRPVKVKQGSGYLTGVRAIAVGEFHVCALKEGGTVWCWGRNSVGQLGDGTTGGVDNIRTKAVKVRQGSGFLAGVEAIGAGADHSCAVTSSGTVWCWGSNARGQLGDGTTGDPIDHIRTKPVKVKRGSGSLTGIVAVAGGGSHTCARRADGTAWCWGFDGQGQLGDDTTGDPVTHLRLTAVKVRRGGGFLTGVTHIAAGISHSCARRSDGTAWCWGADHHGQLGDGTTGDPVLHAQLKAVQVVRSTGPLTGVRRLDGGVGHTCAVLSDRTVRCWGRNESGELGKGSADNDPHPHPSRVLFP